MSDAAAGPGGAHPDIVLAVVVGAHGVNGEVRLKLFADSIESLRRHRTVTVGRRPLTLVSVKGGGTPVARFAEIADRNGAEVLRGAELAVPRSALPPLEEGEYYHADLIGLACVDRDGAPLGTLVAIENFGAGDIVEIERPDGKRAMAPLKPGIVDIEPARLVVDPIFLA